MILLWGIATDAPLAAVRRALQDVGAPVLFLDQQTLLQSKIALRFDGGISGTIETPDWSADLTSITTVYLRPYDTRRMAALTGLRPGSLRYQNAFGFEDALTCWIEMTPAFVVNRPSSMASNNSKPFQLELIRRTGFDVPNTLVTTDAEAALEFWERHKSVIYKSVSGVRSIITKLRPEHRDRFPDIAHCPTQFQQYIEGVDFRLHVVGDKVFGCEIVSAADDYRYPQRQSADVRAERFEVPIELASRCCRLAASLNLPVAGIDLRRTASGQWYCFEVNPSPGFTFYEEATGQPISTAVARLLVNATG